MSKSDKTGYVVKIESSKPRNPFGLGHNMPKAGGHKKTVLSKIKDKHDIMRDAKNELNELKF